MTSIQLDSQPLLNILAATDNRIQDYITNHSQNGPAPIHKVEDMLNMCLSAHRELCSLKHGLNILAAMVEQIEAEQLPKLEQTAEAIYVDGNVEGDRTQLLPLFQEFRSESDPTANLILRSESMDLQVSPRALPDDVMPHTRSAEAIANLTLLCGIAVALIFSRINFGWVGPVAPILSGFIFGKLLSYLPLKYIMSFKNHYAMTR